MSCTIRRAGPGDAEIVLRFIRALADYEKLAHEVVADRASLERDLFGPSPRVFCDLAMVGGLTAGFSLWYFTYSTFQGRHGIWLEDLFVDDEFRGRGAGKALMARLAARCVDEGLGRLEWAVLDWNAPSIAFYESLGARLQAEWQICRLDGGALSALGDSR